MDTERRCTAQAKSTGQRCNNPPIKGSNVCRVHGGAAPQVRRAATRRLLDMVEPAMAQLWDVLHDPETTETGKLRAVQMILDRTGYGPSQTVDVKTSTARIEALLEQYEDDS